MNTNEIEISNKEFDIKKVKKLSNIVNVLLLVYVVGMLFFYACYGIKTMVVYSIIAIAGYILYFILIARDKLCMYMWCVYMTIIIYMAIATISLGYETGFHLYCMSLIPIVFYTKYMSIKIHTHNPYPLAIAIFIVIVNIISTGIAIANGPIYTIKKDISITFLVINTTSVAAFLIYYTRMIVNLVIESEYKLSTIASKDLLTDLYSRRYILKHLEKHNSANPSEWLAMLDVDDFKHINDTYGHNCGDYVLTHISDIMKKTCDGCVLSRWGGEEFLIYSENNAVDISKLELLRKTVEQTESVYNQQKVRVSVTIGVARRNEVVGDIEQWIKCADDKLYYGKNNGKNQVVQ